MILAAAIKYRIEKTGKCVVLCGARHGDVFDQLEALGFDPHFGYEEIEQGFIDHTGQFLTRTEAYEHAKQCGQLPWKIKLPWKIIHQREEDKRFNLISEDLW